MRIAILLLAIGAAVGFWVGNPGGQGGGSARAALLSSEMEPARSPAPIPPTVDGWRKLIEENPREIATARMWPGIEALTLDELVARAREMAASTRRDFDEQAIFRTLVVRWRELDLAGLADFLPEIANTGMRRDAEQIVLSALAREDYARGRELAAQLDDPVAAECTLIGGLAFVDPARAAAEADRLLAGAAVRGIEREVSRLRTHDIARKWAEHNPEEAMTWASALENPDLRAQAMAGAFGPMIKADPAAVAAILAESGDEQMLDGLAITLIGQWGEADWDAAADWAAGLAPGSARAKALAHLAFQRPDETAALLERASPADDQLALAMARALEERSPEVKMTLFEAVDPEQIGMDDLRTLPGAARQLGYDRVLALAANLPDALARKQLADRTIAYQAREDGPAAAAAADAFPDPGLRPQLAETVATNWADRDFTAALEWVLAKPGGADGQLFGRFLSRIARDQTRPVAETLEAHFVNDAAAANDPAFEPAVDTVTAELAARDPSATAAWVAALAPGHNRDSALNTLQRRWGRTDPAGRDAWLDSLPAADREAAAK
ncbi:hypothetical protein BH23VER1_BH23VER1_32870 [soil metagenome]